MAVRPAAVAAAKPVQASVIHFRVERRVTPSRATSGGGVGTLFGAVDINSRGSAYQNGVSERSRRFDALGAARRLGRACAPRRARAGWGPLRASFSIAGSVSASRSRASAFSALTIAASACSLEMRRLARERVAVDHRPQDRQARTRRRAPPGAIAAFQRTSATWSSASTCRRGIGARVAELRRGRKPPSCARRRPRIGTASSTVSNAGRVPDLAERPDRVETRVRIGVLRGGLSSAGTAAGSPSRPRTSTR